MATLQTLVDYDAWAGHYDATRRASQRIAFALLEALGAANGRNLLDIGGGTGNFAAVTRQAGFRVSVADLSGAMLRQARGKLGATVGFAVARAERLPYRACSFDCALLVNVLLHLAQRGRALAEARRVLRSGPLVIRTTTQETERGHWAYHYFRGLASWQPPSLSEGQLADELGAAGFSSVLVRRFWYHGDADGSFQSLKYDPEALLHAAKTQSVAVFKRLPLPELERGIRALAEDLRSGRIRDVVGSYGSRVAEYGDGVIAAAWT